MEIENEANRGILEHLVKIKFIGSFPHGTVALLVPVDTALEEAKLIDSTLNSNQLKKILKFEDIMVFSNIDEYARYKGLK